MYKQNLLKRITTNRQKLDGKPTIRGHHLTVEKVLALLASGETHKTLSVQYNWLEPEDIQACLIYAQQLVSQVRTILSIDELSAAIPKIIEQAPFIKLLILFGSRARGDASQGSDWDFAVLCDEEEYKQNRGNDGWSLLYVWGLVQTTYHLSDDEIDMADLNTCSELLAHSVARDGHVLYEREFGFFEKFKQEHLISPKRLKEIRQRSQEKINETIQVLRNESVRS